MNIKTGSVVLELSMDELVNLEKFIKKHAPDPTVPSPARVSDMHDTVKKLLNLIRKVES